MVTVTSLNNSSALNNTNQSLNSQDVNTSNIGTGLRFPNDLGKDNFNYWMSFSFYTYGVPAFSGNANGGILADQGTLRLPIPNQLMDHQDVIYEQQSEPLGVGAALSSLDSGKGFGPGALNIAGAATAGIGKNVSNALGALAGTGNGAALVTQQFGVAINPFLTVLFKQPAFKRHTFQWKLSPSNQQESTNLNNIINVFRYHQLPNASSFGAGALLTYPDIVQIVLSNNNNNFTFVFKPHVIESLNINFAPSGQPSFFGSTQAPTDVILSLSLLEIEFWLQSDFNGASLNNSLVQGLNQGQNEISVFGALINQLNLGNLLGF